MGYSLSGIVIGKTYKNSLDLFKKQIGLELELVKEISFEEATSGNTEHGYCDICFTDQGTVVFIEENLCEEMYLIKDAKVMTFVLSDTMKMSRIMYSDGVGHKRVLITTNDEEIVSEGTPLAIEKEGKEVSELIWDTLTDIMEEDFEQLEESANCYRYKLSITEVDKSTVRQAVIKGRSEYCHLILEPSERLVFTHDGNITYKKAIVLGQEDGFLKWMKFIVVIMIALSVLTYVYVSWYYALIPLAIMGYLIYSIYTNSDLSKASVIEKKDVIDVEFVKRTNINTIGFDIRFKDSIGKRKVRRFLLPTKGDNQEGFYQKAIEIFKSNGYIK